MSYIGKEPQFAQYPSKFFNGDGTAMTVTLDYGPPNAAALLVFIDGVRQDTSAYTLSGTSLTFTGTVPSGTNNVQVVHLGITQDVGVPTDDTISTAKLQDDAVTSAKILDGTIVNADINASAAIALSKLASDPSNASNLASGTVPTARLGSGTASGSTYLAGDQSWKSISTSANTDAAFLETRSGGYYTSIGSQSWGKMPVGEASATTHFDTASGFDSTNNRWTCPSGQAGKYLIGHSMNVHTNGSDVYYNAGALYKNGSRLDRSVHSFNVGSSTSDPYNYYAYAPYLVELSVGDYIEWYTITWWASSNRILGWSKWGFKLT